MRLIGKLTPKLSLYGTISKTAEVVGSNVQPITIRNNGTYEASNGVDGFNPVYVNTPEPKEEQTKTLNVDENGFYEVLPDNEKVLSSAKINVNVPPKEEQEKVVEIIENGITEVLPDENKVLGKVTVNVDVPVSGGTEEIEQLIDESGVLEDTDGTISVMEKVEKLVGKANDIKAFEGITTAKAVFKYAKSFPNKATVNLLYANDVYQAFSYWNTEPIPIVEELTVNAPSIGVANNQSCMGQMFAFNDGVKKVILNMPNESQYMASTFNQAKILEEIVLNFSTKNIKDYTQAFGSCTALKRIVGVLDFSSATNVQYMFGCKNLEEVTFAPNTLSLSISLAQSSKLTSVSVQSIIDGLATVETAQTLTLNSAIVLTDEQKATINAKGWTLAQ
jgi:hypothetical protein